MAQKKTHDEYVAELKMKNPTVEIIDKYIGARIEIKHRCLIHNVCWEIAPTNALKGNGCPECHREKIKKSRQKTHEQYVLEVNNINPNIVVLERYIDARTPILHKCTIHDIEWKPSPQVVLRGSGCPECWKEKIHNANCRTHEQYVEELSLINPNIVVLETYVNASTPILHKCLIDGYEWFTQPNSLMQGCGCPKCAGNIQLTMQEYIEKLRMINQNIIPIEDYINARTKIMHKCLIDGYEWKIAPTTALQGYGCPKCARNAKLTQDEYKKKLFLINPDIEVVDEYINSYTPIKHHCLKHDVYWKIAPHNALNGQGCAECKKELLRQSFAKTQEQYIKDVHLINPDIEVLGKYVNAFTPILHRCKIDGYEWMCSPTNILGKQCGCPQCSESFGERQVRQWLENHNITYTYQMPFIDCRDTKPLPFDFYLSELNICIEYDGVQHFKPVDFAGRGNEWAEQQFECTQRHDNIKNEYCTNNNIKLLRIPYYSNVEEELNNFLFI